MMFSTRLQLNIIEHEIKFACFFCFIYVQTSRGKSVHTDLERE